METLKHRWVDASPVDSETGALDPSQVDSWRKRGFAFVSGLLPPALIEDLIRSATKRFPAAGTPEAESLTDFGSGGELTFPALSRSFNEVTLHPRLLAAIAALLDTEVSDLRLSQSDLWPKYGRSTKSDSAFDNSDQRIHIDYPRTIRSPTRPHGIAPKRSS